MYCPSTLAQETKETLDSRKWRTRSGYTPWLELPLGPHQLKSAQQIGPSFWDRGLWFVSLVQTSTNQRDMSLRHLRQMVLPPRCCVQAIANSCSAAGSVVTSDLTSDLRKAGSSLWANAPHLNYAVATRDRLQKREPGNMIKVSFCHKSRGSPRVGSFWWWCPFFFYVTKPPLSTLGSFPLLSTWKVPQSWRPRTLGARQGRHQKGKLAGRSNGDLKDVLSLV